MITLTKYDVFFLLQDTPKSQGSFGDGIGDGDHEGKDDAGGLSKSAKDERDRLPPYLPSVNGCRSVEEFHVSCNRNLHTGSCDFSNITQDNFFFQILLSHPVPTLEL